MRIRRHRSWSHGLEQGRDSDMNCRSCIREDGEQIKPDIIGKDEIQVKFTYTEPDIPKEGKVK